MHIRSHAVWSGRIGTSLDARPCYTPTTTFETFPTAVVTGRETFDSRVGAVAEAARTRNDLRERWLNPPDASEAELKKRALTSIHHTRPA